VGRELTDVKSPAMTSPDTHLAAAPRLAPSNKVRARVLVFDSGVGGLSILNEIRTHIPGCELVYACDNAAFPYGTKGEAELVQRVDAVLKALIARIDPDIVVVACNTASTVALPHIRNHFRKPVVGVVPAIKPAAQLSQSRVIGLLATPGTVSRPYTQKLIDEFAADCTIIRVGSSELVQLAEQKLRGLDPAPETLRAILAPIFANPLTDTLVLACTHFPLLQNELEAAAPRPIHWVDSGAAIARRVKSLLEGEHNLPVGHPDPAGFDCWLTRYDADRGPLETGLKAYGALALHLLSV